ncbi:RES family NAD+ phosphorylase [Citrobacter amalonaticus]|uniref:RES family NAD+ phosphorylase n=1 Tax=Citrobacter amalonaticus TaxID=35703 RepID=UPI002E1561BB|nr:RES family NAD+ phosphorylase [Citrobacter amalonaticus]
MDNKIKVVELNSLNLFRNNLLGTIEPETVEKLLRWFLGIYSGINFKFGYDRPIFRARKCLNENGFKNISEIYPPPADKCKTGRMNDEGKSIFYGAYSVGTALAEINAQEGDYVQIAHFYLPDTADVGIRCFAIGEVYNTYHGNSSISVGVFNEIRDFIQRIGNDDIHALLSYLYMDAFSSELLNSINANEINYIYSRVFSRLLLDKHQDVDGLIYPSAKVKGTTNIVLRPETVEEKMQLVRNVVFKITKLYPYGIADFKILRTSKGHTSDGDIIW